MYMILTSVICLTLKAIVRGHNQAMVKAHLKKAGCYAP